jgi:3-oxoacyl-[acyl-carrier-protein] synthase I
MMVKAVVASVGARTAFGGAMETGLMLRAGSAAMAEAALVDSKGEPITFCLLPTLDPRIVGAERAAHMAVPALEDALLPFRAVAGHLRMRLVLCVDEHWGKMRSADGRNPAADLVYWLHTRAKELVPNIPIDVCARGAAGAATIMQKCLDSIASGESDAIILGGAHTDYDPAWIAELEERGRLYSSENLDAMIPGEAAAFVVLMRPDVARRGQLAAHARIMSVATGWEEANPDNDLPSFDARGLTLAVKVATKDLVDAGMQAGWTLTDLTFEMWRLKEWQTMLIRTRKAWAEPYVLDNPAQRLGNLGAAALPLHMVLAQEGWRRGYAPHSIAVAFAGSDAGDRGAIVMQEQ